MKSYFIKKNIFAIIFIVIIFSYSIANFLFGFDKIIAVFKIEKSDLSPEGIRTYVSDIEAAASENLYYKIDFIETYGYVQKLLGKNEINDFAYVKDKNGYLNYSSFYTKDDVLLSEYAKRVRRLKESVKDTGCEVVFINPPGKYIKNYTEVDPGFPINDYNYKQDEFLYYLNLNGIKTLDLREPLLKTGLTYEELFYKTDHHWTVRAGFESASIIVDFLEENYGENLDEKNYYNNINNYNLVEYPNSMLGSMGRYTGIAFGGLDDFELIYPKFDTNFDYYAATESGESASRSGSFYDVMVLKEYLDSTDIYNESKYSAYLETVNPYEKIINLNNPDGLKVLFIRDSFFTPTICFLSPMFSEIHTIWPLATNNVVDIETYVQENEFDYIFVELYPGNLDDESFPYFVEK